MYEYWSALSTSGENLFRHKYLLRVKELYSNNLN
jgi:hypothetical protein